MRFLMLAIFLIPLPLLAQNKDLSFSTKCEGPESKISLAFTGDVLIHKALYQEVVAGTKHFSQIWQRASVLFKAADLASANLEGPAALGIDENGKDHGDVGFIYDDFVYSGTRFVFNYHPRLLEDLKNSGLSLVTMANNHALDRFSIGINRTLQAAALVDLKTTGARSDDKKLGGFYTIAKIKGTQVAFIGCTEMTNGRDDRDDQVLKCFDGNRILPLIRELSSRPLIDAVIVMPHWGVEYSPTPESSQREWGKKYIEAGALAVIGSHPHVLQPWEKVITKDNREGLIIYSLGNFVAGQAGLARKTGTVAYIGLSKGASGKAKIFAVGYTPTYRNGASVGPIGASGPRDVLNHVASMYGTKGRMEPGSDIINVLCNQGK